MSEGPVDCRRALLLQGPAGPFMLRFARELAAQGVAVTKVNFHAGDRHFFPDDTPCASVISYGGRREEWPTFVDALLARTGTDAVFLFGDMRPLHRDAVAAARAAGARVWVFEEGYIRPNWITLEENGVNGNSSMPRDPAFYLENAPATEPSHHAVGSSFGLAAWYWTVDAIAFTHLRRDFPHYEHHRDLNAYRQAGWWVRGAARKGWFSFKERHVLSRLTGELSDRFFFVPLQVHCDFQIRHSPYDDIVQFVDEVLAEFAQHAEPSHHIVFKHHPMDRPFRDYTRLFSQCADRFGLSGRLHYVHDLHLPTLLQHARGTITINSTVGLQSVFHGTPTLACGTAVYDMAGITHQGSLRSFLVSPGGIDEHVYGAFRRWLLHHNQANGNFYKRLPSVDSPTGIQWTGAPTGGGPVQ